MTALEIVRKFHPEVTTVRDANKDIMISVTSKDVNSSEVKKHKNCALAVACKRQFDGAIVSLKTTYLIRGTVATRYLTTESASREIVSFDRKGGFSVGDYKLKKPSPTLRLGSGRQPSEKGGNRKQSPPRFQHRTDNVREKI